MSLQLITKHEYKTDAGHLLSVGDKVEYLGHLPGGWVKIKLGNGAEETAHPRAFEELQ